MSLLMAVVATALIAPAAIAESFNYSWTMNNRVVDGEANGQLYVFGGNGPDNITGSLWAFSKGAGAPASPSQVKFRVYRQEPFSDDLECSVNRTPSSTLFAKRSFNKNCGYTPADTYYIFIYTVADDGWNTTGNGKLRD